jgi:hypothetical protein
MNAYGVGGWVASADLYQIHRCNRQGFQSALALRHDPLSRRAYIRPLFTNPCFAYALVERDPFLAPNGGRIEYWASPQQMRLQMQLRLIAVLEASDPAASRTLLFGKSPTVAGRFKLKLNGAVPRSCRAITANIQAIQIFSEIPDSTDGFDTDRWIRPMR